MWGSYRLASVQGGCCESILADSDALIQALQHPHPRFPKLENLNKGVTLPRDGRDILDTVKHAQRLIGLQVVNEENAHLSPGQQLVIVE